MSRPQKTLTDYIVTAINPALIMILIGSLIFFLIEAFYQGQYDGRLRWAFGWFVFAAVLIGRISIDEGREYAAMYAIPLALAMLAVLSRFVEVGGPMAGLSLPINIGLIALVLWCADRLTWDCTVIDDRKDASGQGLLQTAGLDRPHQDGQTVEGETDLDLQATSSRDEPPILNWWQRFCEHRKRPHAPGVWVIYISLAALPLFGIGQRFIPTANLESRRYAFWMLCYFVASALGLLLNSNFLALRRYLRQRRLEMPAQMAGVWLGSGLMMILILLVLCTALPRPHPEYSITQMDWSVGSPAGLRPSQYGTGQQGAEDPQRKIAPTTTGESSSDGQGKPSDAPQSEPANPGDGESGDGKSGDGKSGDGKSSDGKSSDGKASDGKASDGKASDGKASDGKASDGKASDGKASDGKASDGKAGDGKAGKMESDVAKSEVSKPDETESEPSEPQDSQSQASETRKAESEGNKPESTESQQQTERASQGTRPTRQMPASPQAMLNTALNSLSHALKWLYYLVFFAIVAYLVWRYRAQIRTAIQGFVDAIRDFWARLFGGRPQTTRTTPAVSSAPPPEALRPFAAFADPFATGEARRLSPHALVVYTFHALEAWGREHDCPRMDDQTPHEFAGQLKRAGEDISREATRLADFYCAVAYSNLPLAPASVVSLENLWKTLKSHP